MKILMTFIISAAFYISGLSLYAQQQENSDTLRVKDMGVVFFEPAPAEFDTLISKNETNLKTITDFRGYSAQIIPFLKKKSLRYYFTTQQTILIISDSGAHFNYNRRTLGDIVGIILTDGIKEPLLLPGITKDSDFFVIFKKYFK